jgi:heavy metal translocating P-type ATPase
MTTPDTISEKTDPSTLLSEFFDLGQQESVSPFLQPDSRKWSINLTLKAALAAAFLLLLSFAGSFFPTTEPLSKILLLAVYLLAGIPSLIEAIEDLADGEINIDILMTLAAFSSVFIGSGMEGGLLLVLFALSGAMEDAVTNKARGALSSLHKLTPTKASVIQSDGSLIERAVKSIPVGTHILVKAGQVIPLDGDVIEGTSSVNLVHLTGENFPVTKTVGDNVPAGGRNLEGALTVTVTKTSADSTLSRIIQLVTQAQEARPLLQRWFESASKAYAITIILLSLFFALILPFILHIPFLGIEGSVYRAVAFLIAASPCALIIAIPIAYLSAVSACAKKGILLKGGITLDALAKCRAIAFDKTGTLTTGELTCLSLEALNPEDNKPETIDLALSVAYAMERNTVHPIATAITKYAELNRKTPASISNFTSVPGYGLKAVISLPSGNEEIYIGRPSYIANQLSSDQQQTLTQRTNEIEDLGELLAVLIIGSRPFIFRFRDTPREHINTMLDGLKQRGMELVMLTGDHFNSAKKIADELNIDEFHANLTPEEKLNYVSNLAEKKGLAMIGDGVNDAPALARATVGISMGKVGSSAAIDAADVVLLHDNIELLDWLVDKAKLTQKVVKQNLILATGAIIVASLPALAGFVPLWLAVIMHEGGTVLVGLNALRLLTTKK